MIAHIGGVPLEEGLPFVSGGGSIPAMSPTDIHIIHAAATHTARLGRRGRRSA